MDLGKSNGAMKKIFSVAITLALVTAPLSLAQARAPSAFVAPAQIDAVDMLPAPPANGSDRARAELAELHRIEKQRTAGEIAAARADEAERDIFIFKTVLGKGFNARALPRTAVLSRHVEQDEKADIEPVKNVFRRERPYNFDKSLHPVCWTKIKNDSYPSGHTMTGYLMALVLSSMLPERRDAIFARADEYAHHRLICGVHYPSDVEAGKRLAYALFAVMATKPRFQAERAAAEAEMRKVLGLSGRAN
ncbi:MAG: acid phosphatase [Methylovirgula sp.]